MDTVVKEASLLCKPTTIVRKRMRLAVLWTASSGIVWKYLVSTGRMLCCEGKGQGRAVQLYRNGLVHPFAGDSPAARRETVEGEGGGAGGGNDFFCGGKSGERTFALLARVDFSQELQFRTVRT